MTVAAEAVQSLPAISPRARRRRLLWARFLRRKVAVACLIVIVVFVLAGRVRAAHRAVRLRRRGLQQRCSRHPSWHHLLGTD